MALLVEAITIVIQNKTIEKKYKGGMRAFKANVPNYSFCTDGLISRVAFLTPEEGNDYLDHLDQSGLFLSNGYFSDVAIVHMYDGILNPNNSLFFRRSYFFKTKNKFGFSKEKASVVSANKIVKFKTDELIVPEQWKIELLDKLIHSQL